MKTNNIKYLLLIAFASFFTIEDLNGQQTNNYYHKIANRNIYDTKKISLDSFYYFKEKLYRVGFNFHDPIIKKHYSACMNEIENIGFLDSIYIDTVFARKSDIIRINLSNQVPLELSRAIIKSFLETNENLEINYFDPKVYLQKTNSKTPWKPDIYIGALNCGIKNKHFYVRDKKNIEKLLDAKSLEEFSELIRNYNEEKSKYLSYIKKINNRTRLSSCEEIEDIETKISCANYEWKKFVEENILDKYEGFHSNNYITIKINNLGEITEILFAHNYDVDEKIREKIKNEFKSLPKWVPKKIGNEHSVKSEIYIRLIN